MLSHATVAAARTATPPAPLRRRCDVDDVLSLVRRTCDAMALLQQKLPIQRRVVRAGESIFQAGQRFSCLHVVHSGLFKIFNLTQDGRQQLVALHFKGDWLGFDGIPDGRHECEAVAMDVGEIWSIHYDALLLACAREPALLTMLHAAMSREMVRDRDTMMSLCTLTAEARVAQFLRHWVDSLAERGLRTDQITLRLTRAEIGNYLGMTLESVSRALSRLARANVIAFVERGRRHISIPDARALSDFVRSTQVPHEETRQ